MKRSSTIVAVTSGKGGVGKSVVAVNLAETLAAQGRRVALVDVDFGQGACSVLLNETPSASALDALRRLAPLEQALHRTASGLTLVQAVTEAGEADGRETRLYTFLDQLLTRLRRDHDVIVLDAPAGTDGPVRWALDRADLGLLVLVDEPTAVADAYRLAKLVWTNDPDYPLATVVNFADLEQDALSVQERFGQVTDRFLRNVPFFLGWVPFSAEMRHSVRMQEPAVRKAGALRTAFFGLAQTLEQGRFRTAEAVAT